jgi:hypothetical protein
VYFPTNLQQVQRAVKAVAVSTKAVFGETVMIRGKGHSSNDLVVGMDSTVPVISTEKLSRGYKLSVVGKEQLVEVLAGTELGELDDWLKAKGYGLPVMPDHCHISVGGFASVGGISPASHLYGLFIDTIRWIQYVDREGKALAVTAGTDEFNHLLARTGQEGVIVKLKCVVVKVEKSRELLKLEPGGRYDKPKDYAEAMQYLVLNPPGPSTRYQRGLWARMPDPAKPPFLQIGIIAQYKPARNPVPIKYWQQRNELFEKLYTVGRLAGNLPDDIAGLEPALKALGIRMLLQPIEYATYEDVETMADSVIDASVGSPTHMVSTFVPAEKFTEVFEKVRPACEAAFPLVAAFAIYSRAIVSKYLANGSSGAYVDLSLYLILLPDPKTWEAGCAAVGKIVNMIDNLCKKHNSSNPDRPYLRYMCTQTGFPAAADDDRNPNNRYP